MTAGRTHIDFRTAEIFHLAAWGGPTVGREKTVFSRIIDKELSADIIYEDEQCLAFRDINPQAPTHVLIIPKKEIPSLAEATAEDTELMGHLLLTVRNLAEQLGLANGYRTVVNCGPDAGQTVDHLHIHLLGERRMTWPPG